MFTAVIDASEWQLLLGDTIYYMKHNCDPKKTNYDFVKKIYKEPIKFDIKTSLNYKYQQWFKEIKSKCLNTFLTCNVTSVR